MRIVTIMTIDSLPFVSRSTNFYRDRLLLSLSAPHLITKIVQEEACFYKYQFSPTAGALR